MSRTGKRIIFALVGIIMVIGSLIWMESSKMNTIPIPAITFTIGFIIVLGTIKQTLLGLTRRNDTKQKGR